MSFSLRHRAAWRVFLSLVLAVAVPALNSGTARAEDIRTFKIGVASGTPTGPKIVEFVAKNLASKYGIAIQPVPIADSIQINIATADGQLDGSVFQHRGFLASQKAARGLKLTHVVPVSNTIISVYSKKYAKASDVPEGAIVLIPNDPANASIAYDLLGRWGLIQVDSGAEPGMITAQQVKNPKKVVFKTASLANIARIFEDIDVAVTSEQIWRGAQVDVKYRRIAASGDPQTYAAGLVIRDDSIADPQFKKLIAAFSDPAVGKFVDDNFSEFAHSLPQSIVQTWTSQ